MVAPITVAVSGAAGKMGKEVVKAVSSQPDLKLLWAIDPACPAEDAGIVAGGAPLGIAISTALDDLLQSSGNVPPQVLVDFTRRESAVQTIEKALKAGIACVVGTTGFLSDDYNRMKGWSEASGKPVLVIPNFALGAVLMMKFAAEASQYFSSAEIVELHHTGKLDAPSGTALRTAEIMTAARGTFSGPGGTEKIPGARGAEQGGIRLHSIRLPGLIAHQEVMLGGAGELLTIRHDSFSRESFMPGVLLAIRTITTLKGVIVGLEQILS